MYNTRYKVIIFLAIIILTLTTCSKKEQAANEVLSAKEITNAFSENILEEEYQSLIRPFVEAIKNNNKERIADLILYPLRRQYPIPSINNRHEMLERYNQVFDNTLINIIKNSSVETNWSAVGWRGIMLNDGLIWIDYDGQIYSINYQSSQEREIRNNNILEIKNNLHESLRDFEEPRLLCETENYIVRIDLLYHDNYRLALWTKEKNQNEPPDIIITNGERTFDGSGGNHYYVFTDNNNQYILFVDVLSRSYGNFITYRGFDKDWYARVNRNNIISEENIIRIEN
ncbi:MAG: hypothetical protein LBI28_07595 [Treponema sp.]|jgi:predicted nucleic acid-binding protein|nr:hypothetical protein [Treponema sp.]